MATRVGRCKIRLTSFDSLTQKTPVRRKDLREIWRTSRVITVFVGNFVAMATGSLVAEFLWRHSMARSQIKPTRLKHLGNVSNTSWVIAVFVLNFVAMATSVGRGRICVISFTSPTPKTPCWTQQRKDLLDISYTSRVMAYFVSNFVAMQRGLVVVEFVWHRSIARPWKPHVGREDLDISYTNRVKPILSQISLPWQPGSVLLKFISHHWIPWSQNPLL